MVVDDEPLILSSISRLLDEMDIALITATNAAEALHLLADHEVAVLLTDHCMPAMSGLELAKTVRSRWPATLAILMSGENKYQEETDGLAADSNHAFINKPWQPGELIDALETALNYYQLANEVQQQEPLPCSKERP